MNTGLNKINIIAEVAQGYEGKISLAKKLLNGSIKAKSDAIKFQLIYADEIATTKYPYYNFFKKLEIDTKKWKKLLNGKRKKINFFFDIYGDKSFSVAKKLKADGVKISSADLNNQNLILKSLKNFKSVFITISGLDLSTIKKLLKTTNRYKSKIVLLYGIQSEPTEIHDNNFLKLKKLIKLFPNCKFGVMEHTEGGHKLAKYLPLIPMSYGITHIEKHITIDRKKKFEDYISALSIKEFKEFCRDIRLAHTSLGTDKLDLNKKEIKYKNLTSKVVVASKFIGKEKKIKISDIVLKRDKLKSTNNNFFKLIDVKNYKLKNNLLKNQPILKSDIKKS